MRELDDAGFRDAGELANDGLAADLAGQPRRASSRCCRRWCGSTTCCSADSLASLGTHTVDIDGSDHLALVATVARR